MPNEITWLGGASYRIRNGDVLYIDPCPIDPRDADLILLTRPPDRAAAGRDLDRDPGGRAVIVAHPACAAHGDGVVRIIRPGETIRVGGIRIDAVIPRSIDRPTPSGPADRFGYVITMGGERIYHDGGTAVIPEMEAIDVDVALLPVGGLFAMSGEEASRSANRLRRPGRR